MANHPHSTANHRGSARTDRADRVVAVNGVTPNSYGLPLAPIRPERASAPCDLADYGAGEEFRGWLVVFSRDVDFGLFRRAREVFQAAKDAADAAAALDASGDEGDEGDEGNENDEGKVARGQAQMQLMDDIVAWLEQIMLAWNFVDSRGRPLPQPRDGGAQYCPISALPAITRAFSKASAPPKN